MRRKWKNCCKDGIGNKGKKRIKIKISLKVLGTFILKLSSGSDVTGREQLNP